GADGVCVVLLGWWHGVGGWAGSVCGGECVPRRSGPVPAGAGTTGDVAGVRFVGGGHRVERLPSGSRPGTTTPPRPTGTVRSGWSGRVRCRPGQRPPGARTAAGGPAGAALADRRNPGPAPRP